MMYVKQFFDCKIIHNLLSEKDPNFRYNKIKLILFYQNEGLFNECFYFYNKLLNTVEATGEYNKLCRNANERLWKKKLVFLTILHLLS